MKRLLSVIFIISLLLCGCQNNTNYTKKEEFIIDFFNKPSSYDLFSQENENITNLFYDENIELFKTKQYNRVFDHFDLMVFHAIKNRDSTDFQYGHEIYIKKYISSQKKNIEFLYYTEGTYELNNGQITNISSPLFSQSDYITYSLAKNQLISLYYPRAQIEDNKIIYTVQFQFADQEITDEFVSVGIIK